MGQELTRAAAHQEARPPNFFTAPAGRGGPASDRVTTICKDQQWAVIVIPSSTGANLFHSKPDLNRL
ncbi:MAG: hypothetical protein DMG06_28935 [Acidobacteria bacterium]|nr:MAG: hypothetical protein DMG06_28935 [Acidobacteriota bacterium]